MRISHHAGRGSSRTWAMERKEKEEGREKMRRRAKVKEADERREGRERRGGKQEETRKLTWGPSRSQSGLASLARKEAR